METTTVPAVAPHVDAVAASLDATEALLASAGEAAREPSTDELELTVVMPCLNEERTLPICIASTAQTG